MADMMTRWFKGYRGLRGEVRRVTESLAAIDIMPSTEEAEFEWPAEEKIMQSQMQNRGIRRENMQLDTSGIYRMKGKAWVPESDSGLQIKILVAGH